MSISALVVILSIFSQSEELSQSFFRITASDTTPDLAQLFLKSAVIVEKKFNMGGPIWSAPIHDQEWVAAILADVKSMKEQYPAYDRICAVLTAISEELPDIPLFLSLHNISATLKCTSPSAIIFRSAVINAGYRISGTHVNPLGLKTDAPMHTIWDIMRCWVKNHPVKAQPSNQAGSMILAKEPVLQANFARAVASFSKAQAKKVARFLPNPERHWGPKLRAGRQITERIVKMLVGLGR